MKIIINLPRGDAVADFPSQFSQGGKRKSTEGFLNLVVRGITNTIAALDPGFADLDFNRGRQFRTREFKITPLDAALEPGFADLDFNRKQFRMKMLQTKPVGGDLNLETDLNFDYSAGRRGRRRRG